MRYKIDEEVGELETMTSDYSSIIRMVETTVVAKAVRYKFPSMVIFGRGILFVMTTKNLPWKETFLSPPDVLS